MEAEELVHQLEIPKLIYSRYLYNGQKIQNGIQFACARNKFNSNLIRILEEDNSFRIIFIKTTKPKFDNKKGTMIPHSKKVNFEIGELELNELRSLLHATFQ